jgi:polyribonucleotide nucleotidyltransferase
MISGIPFEGPIGAVRIAYSTEGTWLPHATYQEGDASTFELVVAGRALGEEPDADVAIVMVEAGGTEKAFQYYDEGAPTVTEEVIANGLEVAKTWIRESIELQRQLVREAGSKPTIDFVLFVDYGEDVYERVVAVGADRLHRANAITTKSERNAALDEATDAIVEELSAEFPEREREIRSAVRSHTKKIVRKRIVEEGIRIDGRGPSDIRPLSAEVGLLPTAHGSALFQRGDTQVLNVCTLGMPRMNQLLDTIGIDETKRYMHHYNFPPFSTGETGFMRGPKRREIGHGLLAERALLPVVPPENEFPYVLRLVSDVLSSNGSTSMASVCGSSLSLMDAGVPIKAPVGGIAMGLVFAEGKYTTLTDILGAEDAFGDMDFKVAGTADVVTALQLDTKIAGLPAEVLAQALSQARDARLKVLEVMAAAIAAPRAEVGENAPKIVTFEVPIDKIGEIIGPKGKVINAIQQETGADVNIDDDGTVGTVTIGAKQRSVVDEARRRIELILDPPTPEVGAVYTGRVVNITKFGAFVNILPGRDGLIHISRLGQGRRVERVEDVVTLGQEVDVRVDEIDPQGKVSLSPAGEPAPDDGSGEAGSEANGGSRRPARGGGAPSGAAPSAGREPEESGVARRRASFEDAFASELESTFGNLGPADLAGGAAAGGPRRENSGGRRSPGSSSGTARRRPRGGGR